MNRAWIPAGALAGVSVAGLIAMGPLLTDSLGNDAVFPQTVATPKAPSTQAFVPVSYSKGTVGKIDTRPAVARGGSATSPKQVLPPDAGQVGYRRQVTSSSQTSTATATTNVKPKPSAPATPKAPPAKKRASSIGSVGEANGDSGFAGGSSNKTGLGEQTSTPGNGP